MFALQVHQTLINSTSTTSGPFTMHLHPICVLHLEDHQPIPRGSRFPQSLLHLEDEPAVGDRIMLRINIRLHRNPLLARQCTWTLSSVQAIGKLNDSCPYTVYNDFCLSSSQDQNHAPTKCIRTLEHANTRTHRRPHEVSRCMEVVYSESSDLMKNHRGTS